MSHFKDFARRFRSLVYLRNMKVLETDVIRIYDDNSITMILRSSRMIGKHLQRNNTTVQ